MQICKEKFSYCGGMRWSAVNVHDCRYSRGKQRTNDTTTQTRHNSLVGLLPRGAGAVAVARVNLFSFVQLAQSSIGIGNKRMTYKLIGNLLLVYVHACVLIKGGIVDVVVAFGPE